MKIFSAPTAINLEITDTCNIKCRHCYNFWRQENAQHASLSKEKIDRLVEIFVESGIFHVVVTGGEPFTHFELLEHSLKKLIAHNISVSCNSNLMLVTPDKLQRLRDIGLDHILTSLNSSDPATNDYIVSQKGAFERITHNIELTVKSGIRVSVNMIVSQINKHQVYDTAMLVHRLGGQKIFGTRVVPSITEIKPNESDFVLSKTDARDLLDQLVRAKDETGIMIGTLVSYPLCLLSDLEKYRDFVGRGCPGQTGHIISINANGNTHACVHQEESYGNIFEIGIQKVYANMIAWHDGSYLHKGCNGCDYLDICSSGCRMSAHGYFGKMDECDNLMEGPDNFVKPYSMVYDSEIYRQIDEGMPFFAPKRLRFRREKDFFLINVRWANTISCPTDVAEFLMQRQQSGARFTLDELGLQHRELLAKLYFKDAVECEDIVHDDLRKMAGMSADIMSRR